MNGKTKTIDKRGRLVLGTEFSNRQVQVEKINEFEYRLVFVRTIPERELWLYKNKTAQKSVTAGIRQAAAGQLSDGPDLDEDEPWLADIED